MSLYITEKLNCAKKFCLDFGIYASNFYVLVNIIWRATDQLRPHAVCFWTFFLIHFHHVCAHITDVRMTCK